MNIAQQHLDKRRISRCKAQRAAAPAMPCCRQRVQARAASTRACTKAASHVENRRPVTQPQNTTKRGATLAVCVRFPASGKSRGASAADVCQQPRAVRGASCTLPPHPSCAHQRQRSERLGAGWHAPEVLSLDERVVSRARLAHVEHAGRHARARALPRALHQLAVAQHERAAAARAVARRPGQRLRAAQRSLRSRSTHATLQPITAAAPAAWRSRVQHTQARARTMRRKPTRAQRCLSCCEASPGSASLAFARTPARASASAASRFAAGRRRTRDSSSRYARSTFARWLGGSALIPATAAAHAQLSRSSQPAAARSQDQACFGEGARRRVPRHGQRSISLARPSSRRRVAPQMMRCLASLRR